MLTPRTTFLLALIAVGIAALVALVPRRWSPPPAPQPPPAPSAPRMPAITHTDPVRGATTAPLTIVEVADYTCTHCASAERTLDELRREYGDRLRITWKDFPLLDAATNSRALHIAARCAGQVGNYWEYHDALLRGGARTTEDLVRLAGRIGIPADAFTRCLSDPRIARHVDASAREVASAGITAAPTFFVNGVLLEGEPTVAAFRALLNRESP